MVTTDGASVIRSGNARSAHDLDLSSWSSQLTAALPKDLAARWLVGFPALYRERNSVEDTVDDIRRMETLVRDGDIGLLLKPAQPGAPHRARLKIYRTGDAKVPLTRLLPLLESLGLSVIGEVPCPVTAAGGSLAIWIHDFEVESWDSAPLDIDGRHQIFEQAALAVWRGDAESDGFNALVLSAGLDWRWITVLRAYAKYLRQTGAAHTQPYMERALTANPTAVLALVDLFRRRFDPDLPSPRSLSTESVEAALAAIESADDDRILRRFLDLITNTLRTTYFQRDINGTPKPYLAFKLDARALRDLPRPRPLVEIWVYSPRVEGIHLRGGKVARGGIRWSDRREDFRTEILGLMKAQMVKNTLIVPVGAKGGFVVKRPPPAAAGRPAALAEGQDCYRILIRALLDLTDTLAGDRVIPPERVIRHDHDDPYLVVAADKGTATFSDIANAISVERGFWLGDAFASGGSRGYDHKAMGITARGAWEAVKRHFREIGVDCQTQPVSVIGVGDMSGDVFGNGLLQSPVLRLVGAFNHAHIFIDPDPDPARSFAERQRLFAAQLSWPDYDPSLISTGGGVFARSAKTIPISPQMKSCFGLVQDSMTPTDLIRDLLTQPVDLLFFGGIGTYVKSHGETHAEVGDRANDLLRVDGRDLRARVIGEGANLGMTQLGRVEAARRGIRLNTDAIDNSAGVDTSDHEVNIKILVDGLVADGTLPASERDALLFSMTDEVAHLVLRDNYRQTQALSLMMAHVTDQLDALSQVMRLLEKAGRLDRSIEFLPDDEILTRRAAQKEGLLRPELAVLLGYVKLWFAEAVVDSTLPDESGLGAELTQYFPKVLRARFPSAIFRHRLRREIITTGIVNDLLDRLGIAFVAEMVEKTGHGPAAIARAFIAAREAYALPHIWTQIEALDGQVDSAIQLAMLSETNRVLERAMAWILRHVSEPFDLESTILRLHDGIAALDLILDRALPADLADTLSQRTAQYVDHGVPLSLGRQVANLIVLASAGDILAIAERFKARVDQVGALYFAVGARFSLGRLRAAAGSLTTSGYWDKLATVAAIEDLHAQQRELTANVLVFGQDHGGLVLPPDHLLDQWGNANAASIAACDSLFDQIRAQPRIDLAMLAVMGRQLRSLSDSGE